MAKQIKSLTTMNVKIEQTEHVKMEKSSQEQNNTMVEVRIILNSIVSISFSFSKALSKLIEDPLTDVNDKIKYIQGPREGPQMGGGVWGDVEKFLKD